MDWINTELKYKNFNNVYKIPQEFCRRQCLACRGTVTKQSYRALLEHLTQTRSYQHQKSKNHVWVLLVHSWIKIIAKYLIFIFLKTEFHPLKPWQNVRSVSWSGGYLTHLHQHKLPQPLPSVSVFIFWDLLLALILLPIYNYISSH